MTDILKYDRGYSDYSNPKAFIFFNAFDNASSHVIIAPVISLLMGAIGGAVSLLILKYKRNIDK